MFKTAWPFYHGSIRNYTLVLASLCFVLLFFNPFRSWMQALHGRWLYILIFSWLASFCLTPLAGLLGVALGAIDRPDRRKQHSYPTPRIGGMAVFAGITVSLSLNGIWDPQIMRLMICGVFVFILGVVEDVKGLSAHLRLLGQIIIAIAMVQGGLALTIMPQDVLLGKALNGAITVLWLVGITNAFNFFDGLDGLASGIACIISIFLGIIAFDTRQVHLGWLSTAVLGSVMGFLPYNFKLHRPAEIFLGDGGSTVLGFILAGMAVHGEWAVGHPLLNLSPPLLIFSVLIFDMFHITISRIRKADRHTLWKYLATPGRDHIHHRFEALFRSKRRAVIMVLMLCLSFCLTAFIIRHLDLPMAFLLVLHSIIMLLFITILERAGRLHERREDFPITSREWRVRVSPDTSV